MDIPEHAFQIRANGRGARLRMRNIPMPDTFFYANNVSVAAEIDVDVTWKATSGVQERGKGTDVPSNSPEAYLGEMRDASCVGSAAARQTGFNMETGRLTEEGFFAQLGHSRNGVFLS